MPRSPPGRSSNSADQRVFVFVLVFFYLNHGNTIVVSRTTPRLIFSNLPLVAQDVFNNLQSVAKMLRD
jgi:hypothetical protein